MVRSTKRMQKLCAAYPKGTVATVNLSFLFVFLCFVHATSATESVSSTTGSAGSNVTLDANILAHDEEVIQEGALGTSNTDILSSVGPCTLQLINGQSRFADFIDSRLTLPF